jgi:hypothetical protein
LPAYGNLVTLSDMRTKIFIVASKKYQVRYKGWVITWTRKRLDFGDLSNMFLVR